MTDPVLPALTPEHQVSAPAQLKPTRTWWRRWLRRVLITAAIGAVIWTPLTIYSAMRLANAKSALRAAGYPMTMEELNPPIKDENNAANDYMRAYILMSWDDPKFVYRPGFGAGESDIWNFPYPIDEETETIFKQAYDQDPEVRQVFQNLAKGAEKSECRYPRGELDFNTVMSEISFARSISVGLRMAIDLELARGNEETARSLLSTWVRYNRHHRRDGPMIVQWALSNRHEIDSHRWAAQHPSLPISFRVILNQPAPDPRDDLAWALHGYRIVVQEYSYSNWHSIHMATIVIGQDSILPRPLAFLYFTPPFMPLRMYEQAKGIEYEGAVLRSLAEKTSWYLGPELVSPFTATDIAPNYRDLLNRAARLEASRRGMRLVDYVLSEVEAGRPLPDNPHAAFAEPLLDPRTGQPIPYTKTADGGAKIKFVEDRMGPIWTWTYPGTPTP